MAADSIRKGLMLAGSIVASEEDFQSSCNVYVG